MRNPIHYAPHTDNEIIDVFVFSLDYTAPVMIKTFDTVTGSYVNLTTKITVGDLMKSIHQKSAPNKDNTNE